MSKNINYYRIKEQDELLAHCRQGILVLKDMLNVAKLTEGVRASDRLIRSLDLHSKKYKDKKRFGEDAKRKFIEGHKQQFDIIHNTGNLELKKIIYGNLQKLGFYSLKTTRTDGMCSMMRLYRKMYNSDED